MNSTVSVSKLQAEAPKILRATEKRGYTTVTRHGEMVALLISRDRLEGILETLDLQTNRELMDLVKADKAGKLKYTPFDESKD